jgi:hypothetical protein
MVEIWVLFKLKSLTEPNCRREDIISALLQSASTINTSNSNFTSRATFLSALASTVFDTLLFQRQFSALILTIFDII